MNEINNIDSTVEYDITANGESITDPVALGSSIKIKFNSVSGMTSFFIEKCKSMNMANSSDPDYKDLILVDSGCVPNNVSTDIWSIINPNIVDSGKSLEFSQFAFVKRKFDSSTAISLYSKHAIKTERTCV